MIKHYLKPLYFLLISTLLSACGGGEEAATETIELAPKVINTAPQISPYETSYQLNENSSVIIENLAVSDAQSDTLTVSFNGDDGELFNYDAATGILSFKSAPDYEAPQDSDKNNVYSVELVVSDGELSTTASVEVQVINDIAIEIISPIGDSNIGGEKKYKVLAKINDIESADLGYLNSAQVLINGNAASTLDESYSHWIFELENIAGNSIKAELVLDGMTYSDTINISTLQPLSSVQNIVADEEAGLLYMDDTFSNSIIKVSIDGSSSSVFFDFLEHDLSNPTSLLLDKENNRLLVASDIPRYNGKGAIIAIDLTTQKHEVLSSELKGSGRLFGNWLGDMAFYNDNILISDVREKSLVLVDSNTGDRSTLSSELLGAGPEFYRNEALAVHSSQDIAYVSSHLPEPVILKVNLLSGDRTVVANINDWISDYEVTNSGRAFFIDEKNNQLIFLIESQGTVTLDLETNKKEHIEYSSKYSRLSITENRNFYRFNHQENSIEKGVLGEESVKTIINTKQGENHQVVGGSGSVFSSDLQRLFFVEGNVMSLGVDNKKVSLLSSAYSCNCTPLPVFSGQAITLTNDNKQLLIFRKTDIEETALLSVNPIDGYRTVISANDSASELNFINPIDVVIDSEDTYSYALDSSNYHSENIEVKILQVNMQTGKKILISSNMTHSGIAFTKPNSLTYQPKDNSLLVIQSTPDKQGLEIISVNIDTGERSLILNDIGNEISLAVHDSKLVMDNSLLLKDGSLVIMGENSLYKVDLTSGKSELISSNEFGQGVKSTLLHSLSYDPLYNRLYVMDAYHYGIFSIDIYTGNRSLIVSGD